MKRYALFVIASAVISLTGFANHASAETIYTICDDCTAYEKDRRAKDVIAGDNTTVVIMGDEAARTVSRYYLLILDTAQGIQFRYKSTILSTSSSEHSEYEKLWAVVEKFPSSNSIETILLPADIAETPWELVGDISKQDAVRDWYNHKNYNIFNSMDFQMVMQGLLAGALPKFLGSYAIVIHLTDGGFIVLRANGWITSTHPDQDLPVVDWEIDFESSRDGNGNQIVPTSSSSPITGSLGVAGGYSSAGRDANFIIPGNWVFPSSSTGGGGSYSRIWCLSN